MKHAIIGLAVLLMLLVGEVQAEEAGQTPAATPPALPSPKSQPAPAVKKAGDSGGVAEKEPNVEELRKATEVQELFKADRYDQAVEACNKFLATSKDKYAMALALQAMAESMRKKGDWLLAQGAYQRLRGLYEKGSDEWVRYDAIAEVLKNAKNGVYAPGTTAPAPGSPEAARVLSDDAVLAEALARLAGNRLKGLKTRISLLRHAETPENVLAAVKPAAEEAKRIFNLSKDAPPEDARGVGKAAADRLKEIAGKIVPSLNARLNGYKSKMNSPWSFTNVEKQDIYDVSTRCKQMAESEKGFQDCLPLLAGPGAWADAERFKTDSAKRQAEYEKLAGEFVVPPYTTFIIF